MTKSGLDQELTAIKTITEVLVPLDAESRKRALQYAIDHLGISLRTGISQPAGVSSARGQDDSLSRVVTLQSVPASVVDIRTLAAQKQPSSAIEMATLVAYYLKHQAPDGERRDEITKADVEKYFVQAGFPLPTQTQFTLPNAKNAGYLETAGHGKYKLNSVGHNLIAHNMPRRSDSNAAKPRSRSKKKAAPKKKR